MKHIVTLKCPHCHSTNVIKNGIKTDGKQNYYCKHGCRKQFQSDYQYRGAEPWIKPLVKRALVCNVGVRDCAHIFGISKEYVLDSIGRLSCQQGEWQPPSAYYLSVQLDEFWTFIGEKGRKKWLIYAYSLDKREIIAHEWGGRDAQTGKHLLHKLKKLSVGTYYTDDWPSFAKVLPSERHVVGKENTTISMV
ncbi:insertion element IS1 protein InsB [Catalinimonas alkaloidigena]|nr:insertion element IS1 protein InsB [Catalinimonas alkaloidigena]